MAELQDDIVVEDMGEFQGDPEPKLKPSDRKRLDSIVVDLYNKKATPDEIRFVVEDFKKKYATKPLVSQPKQDISKQPVVEKGREMTIVFNPRAKPKFGAVAVTGAAQGAMPAKTRQRIQRSKTIGKAKEAQKIIDAELKGNDDVIAKWIQQNRVDNSMRQAPIPTSEVQNTGMRV